jgi:hypothetical protein
MATNLQNRGVNNTAFSPNADKTAQLTGTGQAVPGSVVATLAATIALDSYQVNTNYISITNTSAISAVSVTSGAIANPGGLLFVQFTQYSGGSGALTFSTGFRSTGTATPSSLDSLVVAFVSDGTHWCEFARSVGSI